MKNDKALSTTGQKLQKLHDLEMSLHGEETNDDDRADILDAIAAIEDELEDVGVTPSRPRF